MWKEYQAQAATLFKALGFEATIEAQIEGARGKHKIDVWVTGALHGVEFNWVIECKDWKTNIPKEKVLALLSIVQDVGADRGFLLSETGFQSGALRTALHTNVTLTSISDLRDAAEESLMQSAAASLHWRITRVKHELWRLHKGTGDYMSEFMAPMGEITFLDLAIEDALRGEFPTIYAVGGADERLMAENWDDFVAKATELLDDAEAIVTKAQTKLVPT